MMDRSGDDEGNLNFDFLIGLMVFIVAFLFVANAIPGIFMPYASNLVDLGSVAYRTTCILAEDPGWFADPTNGSNGYSNWEDGSNVDTISRVGLAVDKKSPGVLSMDKIHAMESLPYKTSRDKLGLNNTMVYNYSLVIDEFDGNNSHEIMNITGREGAGNVESLNRIVLIRTGDGFLMNSSTSVLAPNNVINVNATPRLQGNVTVRIVQNNVLWNQFTNNIKVQWYPNNNVHALPTNLSYGGGYYYLYKNGMYVSNPSATKSYKGDIIDVVIDMDKIQLNFGNNVSVIGVYGTKCVPGNIGAYDVYEYSPASSYYEYFNAPGIMRLEVWQV